MAKLKDKHIGGFQLAMFVPESKWKLPTEFPDLTGRKFLGIDVEAKDPNLQKQGPGYLRGDAEAVGISLATEDGFKIYLPFAHYSGQNLDRNQVIRYVKDQVKNPNQIKVGTNLMYEQEALDSLDIQMKGPLWDIQVAEPLLDEDKEDGHSLEQLSWDYLGYGKSESGLREAAAAMSLDPKKQMYMLPPEHVGIYAEDDALNPVKIIQMQFERLQKEKLDDVWKLECDLLPVLWKMRKKGLRVDLDYAELLSKEILAEENRLLQHIRDEIDFKVDPWSGPSLMEMFNRLGLAHYVNYTLPSKNHPQGQPSFTNDFFKSMVDVHPICAELANYRGANKMRRDFVGGLILGKNINGRLHPQWHQLKKKGDDDVDDAGAETGRITSSKPCLTQVPIRSPLWGKKIRRTFIADKGGRYCKNDYSQQEPRWTLHFAYLKRYEGAAEARQKYIDDPSTDYHDMTKDLIFSMTGQLLERRYAKDINLGAAYGMGIWKLAKKLGVDIDTAKQILKTYHEGMPFVKKLGNRFMELALGQGFVRTILGRKRRFQHWEPVDWDKRKKSFPIRNYDEAIERWQEVQRADAHKAMNSAVQGSAADQTKRAIVLLDQEGLTPQIQVYDELGQTVYSDRDAWRIAEVMEHAIETTVPHLATPDVGPNWADVKELMR